jgi:hypothetical protein
MRQENPFRQWLEADTYVGTWVPVGQLGGWVAPTSNPVLFPAGQKEVMLSDCDWPIRIDGAQPEVWGYPDEGGEAYLRPRYERGGVDLEPFAAYFDPPDRRSWLEPIQAFVLYLQAAPRHQAGGRIVWEVRDEDGKPEEVARWVPLEGEETGGVLGIRRDLLLRFMRDFAFDLAIFYEDNRRVDGVADGWRDQGREDLRAWRCWATDVGDHVRGLLRAVTILERPPPAERRAEDEAHGKTLEYIIGIDPRTGDPATDSFPGPPNAKTAHPGAGNDNFLTPVFFRPEVLDYYLSDPRHYKVDAVQVAAGGMWSIRIARTERGNIQVWLGDLGLISDRAQDHWRQFNISDDDAVPEWRERRDFKAEWVETPRGGSVERVRQAIEECNEVAAAYYGVPLYAAVEGMNKSRLGAMHTPLNSSLPAFQQQVTSLAILVGDHVNADFLTTVGVPKGGSPLNRMAEWLEGALSVSREQARDLIGGLYAVQAIRSEAGAAHRAGERANEVLSRAGVDPDDLPAGFDTLAEGAARSIENVRDALRSLSSSP